MQFVDTHSHLYLKNYNNDIDDVINRSVMFGVNKILLPNIDSSTIKPMLELSSRHKGICYPMIGIHPTSVRENYHEQFETVKNWLNREKFIAIGEIGIDLYWDLTFLKEQSEIFIQQIELAIKHNKPVVIHCRSAFNEIFKLLKPYRKTNLKGVFHSFTGDTKTAEHIINLGFMIGIGGIVTYKNTNLDKVLAEIGIENILLETDSPYLTPTPHRGKRNESSYIPIIAQRISELTGKTLDELAETSTKNANKIFKLD